ncbi:arginine--tRNA ligase [Candidatus Finniella inopinata]|uniref:Arginine--tRNA ligase n=1 Tax=Candidatus Finniella inopinata TaxID=1696036 RepID=A0A4Q7DKL2_9PROT|nr:arginine--tRNA ligase [Candidatus Finniella inopinata]RZI45216.1 arginine--tRNA ligase [Candidatus Finniella inopinata]
MNLFPVFHAYIIESIRALNTEDLLPSDWQQKITIEPTRDPSHGDLATNAAMVLAKPLGQSPKDLAQRIASSLLGRPEIIKAEVAGPGFINLTLSPEFWQAQIPTILEKGINYGDAALGANQKVNVEFVSTNPTGPMHAGHGRNAVLGDTVSALLSKVGYDVCREYYVNDAGGQINALARSVYVRYRQACGETISDADFDADMYGADYLVPLAKQIFEQDGPKWLGQPQEVWLDSFREVSVHEMMNLIRQDLEALGVHMNVFTSEKVLAAHNQVQKTLDILQAKGDVYQGTLAPPKDHVIDDWEPRPQTLFKATAYGDDVDRPLCKSDGAWTYFAGDVAYHHNKLDRGFDHLVNIFGADHSGYVKRIQSAVKALTDGQKTVEIKVCQMVNFLDNGVPVRMSKRAGTFITLKEVIERVGKDATRYMMVSRHQDMPIDFDFAKVIEQNRDNPIFYIQYAHARIQSVLRHSREMFPSLTLKITELPLHLLKDDYELAMIKILTNWPRQVEVAAQTREPHRIANFLYDVASTFHGLWNKGKDHTHLRFIDPQDFAQTQARLALITATATVIASGLKLLGITPVQEMR